LFTFFKIFCWNLISFEGSDQGSHECGQKTSFDHRDEDVPPLMMTTMTKKKTMKRKKTTIVKVMLLEMKERKGKKRIG